MSELEHWILSVGRWETSVRTDEERFAEHREHADGPRLTRVAVASVQGQGENVAMKAASVSTPSISLQQLILGSALSCLARCPFRSYGRSLWRQKRLMRFLVHQVRPGGGGA